jgi:hypothetical protein
MNYDRVFLDALHSVLIEYGNTQIDLLSESDLKAHLFSECINLMRKRGFPSPFKVYAEKGVFDKRKKIDLVLGDNEVLVELKFEPESSLGGQGRVFDTVKQAGGMGYGSVEEDLQKIDNYAKKGKHAHFVMIDETGWHAEAIVPKKWKHINVGSKKSYLLHIRGRNEGA